MLSYVGREYIVGCQIYVCTVYILVYVLVWFKYIRSTTKVPGLLYYIIFPKAVICLFISQLSSASIYIRM